MKIGLNWKSAFSYKFFEETAFDLSQSTFNDNVVLACGSLLYENGVLLCVIRAIFKVYQNHSLYFKPCKS